MDISIYLKSTGQIVQTRNVSGPEEIHLADGYGYIEGRFTPGIKKWNGTEVVDYTESTSTSAIWGYQPPATYTPGDNELNVRIYRQQLLQQSDWTQLPDSPLTDAKKAEWATYRQELREILDSYTDSESNTVDSISWPTPPK